MAEKERMEDRVTVTDRSTQRQTETDGETAQTDRD